MIGGGLQIRPDVFDSMGHTARLTINFYLYREDESEENQHAPPPQSKPTAKKNNATQKRAAVDEGNLAAAIITEEIHLVLFYSSLIHCNDGNHTTLTRLSSLSARRNFLEPLS